MRMYVCMYYSMYVCMYVCVILYMYVCMYVIMYVLFYECIHVSIYVCMHVCIFVCIYIRYDILQYNMSHKHSDLCRSAWLNICTNLEMKIQTKHKIVRLTR